MKGPRFEKKNDLVYENSVWSCSALIGLAFLGTGMSLQMRRFLLVNNPWKPLQ